MDDEEPEDEDDLDDGDNNIFDDVSKAMEKLVTPQEPSTETVSHAADPELNQQENSATKASLLSALTVISIVLLVNVVA